MGRETYKSKIYSNAQGWFYFFMEPVPQHLFSYNSVWCNKAYFGVGWHQNVVSAFELPATSKIARRDIR